MTPANSQPSPEEVRLRILLAPIIAMAHGHGNHLDTHTKELTLPPEQRAHLDEVKAALKKIAHHGAALSIWRR